jgi:hypothetical protein
MTHEDDRFSEFLRKQARDYNRPPELSRSEAEEMWSAIEAESFARRGFTSPSAEHAALSIGRPTFDVERWFSARGLLPLAAVLVLGVAIGRFALPRKAADAPSGKTASRAPSDSVSLAEPYQSTTSQYLGQTAALLVALPGEVRAGRADDRFLGRAHDLLLTTRLLLDSPAAADPRFRTLLEDLELVLAQVVRLQTDQSRSELDLIRQALEQRDVLPRLRTAVADISADD